MCPQDAEYVATLEADRVRAAEREAARAAAAAEAAQAEAQRKEKARKLRELSALKESLRAALPEEPAPEDRPSPESGEGTGEGPGDAAHRVITVRVRLPDGSQHTRRWRAEQDIGLVHDWVQSIEAMPL